LPDSHEVAVAALAHAGDQVAREVDRRTEVDVERPVDLPALEGGQIAGRRQPRVGDEHVHDPGAGRQLGHRRGVGEIRCEHLGPLTELAAQTLEHIGLAAAEQDDRSAPVQLASDRHAKPAGGARYQGACPL
jgi:hypothetical protein